MSATKDTDTQGCSLIPARLSVCPGHVQPSDEQLRQGQVADWATPLKSPARASLFHGRQLLPAAILADQKSAANYRVSLLSLR